ncbi:MAG: sarcosine oxidase subunit alpha family protein [Limibacillus sp.]
MRKQPNRLTEGGRIDRASPLDFTFDGRRYLGYQGDSLASALLANGVSLVGRSFKYHRPRGVYSAGVEEPNALVALRSGARHEPNVQATMAPLYDGLESHSQNAWPSLAFDAMAVNGLFSPIFGAGFYYKTFMGPTRKAWMLYEHFIRKAAGMGRPTDKPDPDRYEKGHLFCDLLVVGGGPAGLSAAIAAARSGARVVLAEQDQVLGGSLLNEPLGAPSDEWLAEQLAEIDALPNLRVMTRTTVFGAYDNHNFGLLEHVGDDRPEPEAHQPRQRFWYLQAKGAVIATGAIERPLVFSNNDLPGVMLASAGRAYLNRYGVLPGRSVLVFTNNDSAYLSARDLAGAGAQVTVVDARAEVPGPLQEICAAKGIELRKGEVVTKAKGGRQVTGAVLSAYDPQSGAGPTKTIVTCDLLLVAGGWNPTVHLLSQRGNKPVWNETAAAFVPGPMPSGYRAAGAVTGDWTATHAAAQGAGQGRKAAEALGFSGGEGVSVLVGDPLEGWAAPLLPLWQVKPGMKKAFLDLQHDVSTSDVDLAHREGFVSVEHMKRYTTLGMAADQGRLSNVNALAILAGLRDEPIPEVGTTTFRPPFSPVTIGALAGQETGQHFRPLRRTSMHDWHEARGAKFIDAGLWHRAHYYPQPGEDLDAAYRRETKKVRETVGIVDVSTLGKIDVQGPDAGEFLNRLYVNGFGKLPVGKARYGVMLRVDGIVLDDGTTSRLSETHYFMTTTTANAARVLVDMEFLLQTQWTDLKVQVTSVTDQWQGLACAGPLSRKLLSGVVEGIDFSNEGLPHMGVAEGRVGDIPVRIMRLSFSGEMAYEVYARSGHAEAVWEAVVAAGEQYDAVLYGLEALGALRIEKGHVAGQELDGRTTMDDLGLSKMASTKKRYWGQVLAGREGLTDPERPKLVGLEPLDAKARLKSGSLLFAEKAEKFGHGEGHITAVTYSPVLGHYFALGLLSHGPERHGEVIEAHDPLRGQVQRLKVVSPHMYDPKGERLDV